MIIFLSNFTQLLAAVQRGIAFDLPGPGLLAVAIAGRRATGDVRAKGTVLLKVNS